MDDCYLIKKFEGFKPIAYRDVGGVLTIGYGFTHVNGKPVHEEQTMTLEDADNLLSQMVAEIKREFNYVQKYFDDKKRAAFNSLVWNVGEGSVKNSHLLGYVVRQEYGVKFDACWLSFCHCQGRRLKQLEQRRMSELNVYHGGDVE